MKNSIFIFLLILSSCQIKTAEKRKGDKVIEPKEILNGEYKSIGQNLYADQKGNIYFRTIDRSAQKPNREVDALYLNKLVYDSVINGEVTYMEIEFKSFLDVNSFKRISNDHVTTYYKDKNHGYFIRGMADGGTLRCIK